MTPDRKYRPDAPVDKEKITAALTNCGYPVTRVEGGWLVCGEANPVLEALKAGGAEVNGVVIDPPWLSVATAYPADSVSARKSSVKQSGRQWSDILTLKMAFQSNFALLRQVCADNGGTAIFCGAVSSAMFMQVAYGLWRRTHLLAWEKGFGRVAMPMSYALEFILLCTNHNTHRAVDIQNPPSPVLRAKSVRPHDRIHDAQKPTELLEILVRLTTPPDGVVLDCFAGSHSTMLAARNTGRDFLCVEADEEFYNRAVNAAKKYGVRKALV